MSTVKVDIKANSFNFDHIGWKYYQTIKKKAMEREFSWSGLIISMSIAFFIVIAAAVCLNLVYISLNRIQSGDKLIKQKIYRLESFNSQTGDNYLQTEYLSQEQIKQIKIINIA